MFEISPGAALDHLELVEAAFQCTVIQRELSRGGQSDRFTKMRIGGQNVGAPPCESALEPIAELWIERLELPRLAHPHAVGRIDYKDARGGRRLDRQDVLLPQPNVDSHACALEEALCRFDGRCIVVRGIDRSRSLVPLF